MPVGRSLLAGELGGPLEVRDRRMEIGPVQQRAAEREMRIGGGGACLVPELLCEREGVPGQVLRPFGIPFLELDEGQVRHPERSGDMTPSPRQCPRLLERRPSLLWATSQEQRLPERHEPGVAPWASGRLALEHEPGGPLGVVDAAAQVGRADHRHAGTHRRDPVRQGPEVGPVLCDGEPALDLVASLPAESRGERAHDRELAVGAGLGPREQIEPAVHGRHPAHRQQGHGRDAGRARSPG